MIGEKLKSLRNESTITQAELAKALNVTRSAVALWETDKTDPDISNLIAIAKYFSITVDELLGIAEANRIVNCLPSPTLTLISFVLPLACLSVTLPFV